jgi:hypothetical protein
VAGLSTDALYTLHGPRIAPGDADEFLRLLQEADTRLLEWAKWRWTRGRADLTPADQVVTLPINYVSILACRIDKYPSELNAEEFEFAPGGPGELVVGAAHGLRVIDQGLNDSGARYYKVLGMSGDDFTLSCLAHYAPLTLYYTAELPGSPSLIESATTRCPSAAALKLAMRAILFEEANDPGSARSNMADALRVLDSHEKAARGGARQVPNVRQGGAGLSKIRVFR